MNSLYPFTFVFPLFISDSLLPLSFGVEWLDALVQVPYHRKTGKITRRKSLWRLLSCLRVMFGVVDQLLVSVCPVGIYGSLVSVGNLDGQMHYGLWLALCDSWVMSIYTCLDAWRHSIVSFGCSTIVIERAHMH